MGADLPPIRLHIIKTMLQPSATEAIGCTDRDCLLRDCQGNKVDVLGMNELGSGGRGVTIHLVHHKNDRKGFNPITVEVPPGQLLDLMLIHIERGREALNDGSVDGEVSPNLFVSNKGNTFSDATFVHYWTSLMRDCDLFGFERFPPTHGRTIFVQDYTEDGDPEMWEGAALVMGNSLRQWKQTYWPSRNKRMVDRAISNHVDYVQSSDSRRRREDDS